MGVTRLRLKVKKDASSRKHRELMLLIDSGAVHSVVPGDLLRELGIKPFKKTTFILANGETIERQVGTGHFIYRGHEGGAPVVFGEEGDSPLLGATTLEALELALNPLRRELYPLELPLMGDTTTMAARGGGSVSVQRRSRR